MTFHTRIHTLPVPSRFADCKLLKKNKKRARLDVSAVKLDLGLEKKKKKKGWWKHLGLHLARVILSLEDTNEA